MNSRIPSVQSQRKKTDYSCKPTFVIRNLKRGINLNQEKQSRLNTNTEVADSITQLNNLSNSFFNNNPEVIVSGERNLKRSKFKSSTSIFNSIDNYSLPDGKRPYSNKSKKSSTFQFNFKSESSLVNIKENLKNNILSRNDLFSEINNTEENINVEDKTIRNEEFGYFINRKYAFIYINNENNQFHSGLYRINNSNFSSISSVLLIKCQSLKDINIACISNTCSISESFTIPKILIHKYIDIPSCLIELISNKNIHSIYDVVQGLDQELQSLIISSFYKSNKGSIFTLNNINYISIENNKERIIHQLGFSLSFHKIILLLTNKCLTQLLPAIFQFFINIKNTIDIFKLYNEILNYFLTLNFNYLVINNYYSKMLNTTSFNIPYSFLLLPINKTSPSPIICNDDILKLCDVVYNLDYKYSNKLVIIPLLSKIIEMEDRKRTSLTCRFKSILRIFHLLKNRNFDKKAYTLCINVLVLETVFNSTKLDQSLPKFIVDLLDKNGIKLIVNVNSQCELIFNLIGNLLLFSIVNKILCDNNDKSKIAIDDAKQLVYLSNYNYSDYSEVNNTLDEIYNNKTIQTIKDQINSIINGCVLDIDMILKLEKIFYLDSISSIITNTNKKIILFNGKSSHIINTIISYYDNYFIFNEKLNNDNIKMYNNFEHITVIKLSIKKMANLH